MTAGRDGWDGLTAHRLTAILGPRPTVAVLYWPSVVPLDAIWRGTAADACTHRRLVLRGSLSVTAPARERLKATLLRPFGWVWVLLTMLGGPWLRVWRAAIQFLDVLLSPAILLTTRVAALSSSIARRCVLPLALWLFATPTWGSINQSL
jgi:hypothetical protein